MWGKWEKLRDCKLYGIINSAIGFTFFLQDPCFCGSSQRRKNMHGSFSKDGIDSDSDRYIALIIQGSSSRPEHIPKRTSHPLTEWLKTTTVDYFSLLIWIQAGLSSTFLLLHGVIFHSRGWIQLGAHRELGQAEPLSGPLFISFIV